MIDSVRTYPLMSSNAAAYTIHVQKEKPPNKTPMDIIRIHMKLHTYQ